MSDIAYEKNCYICPFCDNTDDMLIIKTGNEPWDMVADQFCSNCSEAFDLETWDVFIDDQYDNIEYYDDEYGYEDGYIYGNNIFEGECEDDFEDVDEDDFEEGDEDL